jgi:hypothetical protein
VDEPIKSFSKLFFGSHFTSQSTMLAPVSLFSFVVQSIFDFISRLLAPLVLNLIQFMEKFSLKALGGGERAIAFPSLARGRRTSSRELSE